MELGSINCDTDLSDILLSQNIIDTNLEIAQFINKISEPKKDVLEYESTKGGLANNIIDGEKPLVTAATTIKDNYSNISTEAIEYVNAISEKATNREMDELLKLEQKVDEKVSLLASCLNNAQSATSPNEMIDPNTIQSWTNSKKNYEEKLKDIRARLSKLGYTTASTTTNTTNTKDIYVNEIPKFDPSNPEGVSDFIVDSHHRLNAPGFGICYEASANNKLEFHYDKKTNQFYFSDVGTDWDNYDYSSDIYGISPEDMADSVVAGGIIPG